MRRLVILIASLAMVLVAPATASATHDEHEEFTLTTEFHLVGVSEDGGDLYEGWHYLYDLEGNLADDGPAHAVVYGGGGGNYYTGTITYEGSVATAVAKIRGSITGFEETETGAIITFAHMETIVEAPGFAGRGAGTVTVELGESTTAFSTVHYHIRPAG